MTRQEIDKRQPRFALFPALKFFTQIGDVRTELLRKSIHFLIALTPTLASFNRGFTIIALASGTLVYACAESARRSGITVPLVTAITTAAARDRDRGHFIMGPVTLGIGAMLALLMYPDPAASIAIYALAFGDGLASLIGKLFGRVRPAFLQGKSLEGSVACFMAVFVATHLILHDVRVSFFAALVATFVEAFPLDDYDNIALPVSVGFTVEILQRL